MTTVQIVPAVEPDLPSLGALLDASDLPTDGLCDHFGFVPVARGDVPDAVRQSIEFVAACPATARCLALDLAR